MKGAGDIKVARDGCTYESYERPQYLTVRGSAIGGANRGLALLAAVLRLRERNPLFCTESIDSGSGERPTLLSDDSAERGMQFAAQPTAGVSCQVRELDARDRKSVV